MNYSEKNKIIDSLCGIGLMLLLTEVFYGIVDNAYTVYSHNINHVTIGIQIAGAVFLAVAIIIMIRAYKKDDGSLAVYGIEFLALAILAALLPGAYISFPRPYSLLAKGFPFIFLAYYFVKLIVIVILAMKKTHSKKG